MHKHTRLRIAIHLVHTVHAGHSDGLETGAMSSDDSMVLTAAYDKSARVWDLASGKCLAVLASSAQVCSASALFV